MSAVSPVRQPLSRTLPHINNGVVTAALHSTDMDYAFIQVGQIKEEKKWHLSHFSTSPQLLAQTSSCPPN